MKIKIKILLKLLKLYFYKNKILIFNYLNKIKIIKI